MDHRCAADRSVPRSVLLGRIAIPGYLALCALLLLDVLRFREDMVDGARTSVYVATLVALFVLTAIAGWRQETRRGVSDRGRREKLSR